MIIQCDQCNTKFKLDDAKVPDKGVKVRCAKCKHIFKVQREVASEETDFDFLLSGLGAPASDAEKGVSQSGGAVLPSTGGDEGRMFAEAAGTTWEEPAQAPLAGRAEQAGREDFGEDFFAVKEEPAPPEEKGFAPGEFPFEGEQADMPAGAAAAPESGKGETTGFEFGEYPFAGEDSATQSGLSEIVSAGSVETEGFDFAPADFGADESAVMKEGEGLEGIAAGQTTDEAFSFGEEPAPPEAEMQGMEWQPEPPAESEETFVFSAVSVPPLPEKEAETATFAAEEKTKEVETEHIDYGDIAGGVIVAGPAVTKTEEIKPALQQTTVPPEPVPEKLSAPSFAPSTPSAEEELPPLAISTRRKGSSVFAIVVTAIAVLIVLAIAGFGFYVFKEGPAAFDKLKLSFLARWVGMEAAEEGGIAIKNPQGAFMVNRVVGDIFVISGEAVNNFKKPRASIQVKAIVLGPKGETVMQKTAYCGNLLSKEQLTTLPMAKIEEAMGSPFGDSLANLGVQPGKGIPFVVVFSGVPKNAAEFSVEVAGSTVAGQ
jgi:predicted Zn finger-like uncharacterized protein